MHGAEAIHGDLGMLTRQDIVLAISYSGAAHELVTILSVVKRMGARLISITGNPQSELARNADLHLDAHVAQEACPRSEEHTSELQSLMRISSAVFCLKKNKQHTKTQTTH